ncbi:MAG: tetratricopeptide repeat protein, partial [Candidatus Omnitrophica bacterium]|nr:tetratricopeptide repeat protein [Candidatus Omnitrophota bacterium]
FNAASEYKNAEYQKAVDYYTEILKKGLESGPLYYNLGNAYFKIGDSGRAVLNYERALRLMPTDNDLQLNYRYVTASIKNYKSPKSEGLLQKMIDEHIRFYSRNEMVLILTGVFFLALFFWLLAFYLRWSLKVRLTGSILCGTLFVVFLAGLVFECQHAGNAAIVLDPADAKFEPRDDATTHFSMFEGERIKTLRQDGGWLKIQRADGKEGWVDQNYVERI